MAEIWITIKPILSFTLNYILPIIAIGISIFSYRDSRKANKVQMRLNEMEEILKKYELEDREKEKQEENKACVEARIINISNNQYRIKVWNSGKATAHNVEFKIPKEANCKLMGDKTPYDFLEPGKSFEDPIWTYNGTKRKFKVTTSWENESGNNFSRENMVSF